MTKSTKKPRLSENGMASPQVNQKDFRAWEPEIVTGPGGRKGTIRLCAELNGGRWEYFYTAFKPLTD